MFKFKLNSYKNCLKRALLLIADIKRDYDNNENVLTCKTYDNLIRFLYSNFMSKDEFALDRHIEINLTSDENALYRINDIFYDLDDEVNQSEDEVGYMLISKTTINKLNRFFYSKYITNFISTKFVNRRNDE